jgi:hypothetical protein
LESISRRVPNDKVTVSEYLDRWITGRKKIRRATRVSYQGHIDNYLTPHLGEIKLRDLASHHIVAMFSALEERNEDIRRSLETAPRADAATSSPLRSVPKEHDGNGVG